MRHRPLRRLRLPELFVAFLTAACAFSVAVAAPPAADDARMMRAEAVAALQQGDRSKAVTYVEAAARLAPEPGLWMLAGDLQASLDRPAAASKAWASGLELAPSDPDLLDRAAWMAAHIGDWSRAAALQGRLVAVLAERAAVEPDGVRLDMLAGTRSSHAHSHRRHLARLSTVAVLAGDYTTGESAARALVTADRKSTDGHLALGYVFLQAREFDTAAEAYLEVLALEPDNTIALNNLGTIFYMQRDLKGAGAQFEAVLGSAERNAHAESIALANLGELHQIEARYDDAEYLYAQAVEAFPAGAWSYMGRAALLDVTGRYDAALDAMIDGWERDTNRLTRLNMHFFQPEWAWQRDALIAEIEGRWDDAAKLWSMVRDGDVSALRRSAEHHLHSIELLTR